MVNKKERERKRERKRERERELIYKVLNQSKKSFLVYNLYKSHKNASFTRG
jgi:hypothetical protein